MALPNTLAQYFPILPQRKDLLQQIRSHPSWNAMFQRWKAEDQTYFLDACCGVRGHKILFDGFFKEIFNAEYAPERLSGFLSALLNQNIRVKALLPNDSVRLGEESSLVYTDIVVELDDGSLANVEIQKLGYAFPGQRSACYCADNLLRQYKRVRGEKKEQFSYRDIKRVYTIVLFEKSPEKFWNYPTTWRHHFRSVSDTGMELELLAQYIYVSLDIYRETMENKIVETELEAWLSFLAFDMPERIIELITRYPAFKAMYQDIYEMCLNVERVMNMYSKELLELDRNTVRYMMDEMQETISRYKVELKTVKSNLAGAESNLAAETEKRLEAELNLEKTESTLAMETSKRLKVEAEARQLREELDTFKKKSGESSGIKKE